MGRRINNTAAANPSTLGIAADDRRQQTAEFRAWLKEQLERIPMSLHSIEVSADIRGNALGKFLRGERGGRHSLTPLMIRRLAPVVMIGEEELLARAGHLGHEPDGRDVEAAILADRRLGEADKALLTATYRRLREGNV